MRDYPQTARTVNRAKASAADERAEAEKAGVYVTREGHVISLGTTKLNIIKCGICDFVASARSDGRSVRYIAGHLCHHAKPQIVDLSAHLAAFAKGES